MQNLQEKIKQEYRVNLVLDNLPATTCDLEEVRAMISVDYLCPFFVLPSGIEDCSWLAPRPSCLMPCRTLTASGPALIWVSSALEAMCT